MLSVYYKIWIDAIKFTQTKTGKTGNWMLATIIPISIFQGINLLTILLWLRAFSKKELLVIFPLHIFNVGPVNSFISVIVTYFVPFVILNYLLIFYNRKYNELMKRYRARNGKRYLGYALISIGICVAPMILKRIF